ncbi:ABC transporter permease subunit, partial [candidate division KSB3 bacterium]|nr:ABC transporter permease subunit [candidate division KSB3 bacterium]MBD3327616.1 ABC transporter permease subunit [candidate division KSB3 bacterium]
MALYLKKRTKTKIAGVVLLVITVVTVAPLLWMLLASVKTTAQMFANPPIILPPEPTWENYKALLTGTESRLPFLVNSLVISLTTTVIVMVLATPAAFGFAKMRIRGSRHLEFWILSTRMMPPIAALIPIFLIIRKLGLFDTKPGIILPYIAFNLPYAVWMMTIFFRQLPSEIDEAAMLDGCTWGTTFFRIGIPLVLPSLITVAIFVFIFSWNELLFALILTGREAKTLPVAISEYSGGVFIRWELMAAASILQIIPAVLVVVLLQRYIISGLTMGAVEK